MKRFSNTLMRIKMSHFKHKIKKKIYELMLFVIYGKARREAHPN